MEIPKIIHRIWLGDAPLPEEFERFGRTWRDHHPDWELRLWTERDLPKLRYAEAFDRGRNYAERSDVLRYELLLSFGGVYVDTDVECRRPIEPLIEGTTAFAAWSHPTRVGTAVVGAVPEHPAIGQVLEQMAERVGHGNQNEATGPIFVTSVLAGRDDVTLFGKETFYPFNPRRPPAEGDAFPDAYAVHYYDASYKSREELRDKSRELRRRLDQARQRNRELERELREARRRLLAMQRSRWWRLRARLARALGPARPLARRLKR